MYSQIENNFTHHTPVNMTKNALCGEKPECYEPEKYNPYPLCIGKGLPKCETCCLWIDLPGPYDNC